MPRILSCANITAPFTASFLPRNRRFVCPGENHTFNCKGVGSTINVFAPKQIPENFPLTFTRGDEIGSVQKYESIVTRLISTDRPFMEVNISVLDPTMNTTIYCTINSNESSSTSSYLVMLSGMMLYDYPQLHIIIFSRLSVLVCLFVSVLHL